MGIFNPNYNYVIDLSEYSAAEWSDVSDWPDFMKSLSFTPKYVASIQTDELQHIRQIVKWYEKNADADAMVMWIPAHWQFYRRIVFSETGSDLALEFKLRFGDTLASEPVQACDD
jgi:hypothetical protein